ncbi:MAG: FtsW/RodA/SpoVE family cell cycle protein, partial [Oscillospiraceae bacterium]|nr:FtsW/RodA/SpoVE family cell cycle protein [Oscillospiraceae bacterium]
IGVSAMIFTHCFMNIGMVLKVMPVIGVPLPFLSAGGTATLSMYVAIGLVISVRTHNERKYNVFYDYKSPAISERRNHNHI